MKRCLLKSGIALSLAFALIFSSACTVSTNDASTDNTTEQNGNTDNSGTGGSSGGTQNGSGEGGTTGGGIQNGSGEGESSGGGTENGSEGGTTGGGTQNGSGEGEGSGTGGTGTGTGETGSGGTGTDSGITENQSDSLSDAWWRESSFYHIWVKAFADSDGDGCGDFKGIENKLSYIQDTLGCDAIWLSPIFDCSSKGKDETYNMHGYDTTDYYAVNSYFGTESDLTSLIEACHDRGIKIIFDFVPNHTSKNHQWFKDSVAKTNGKTDWYLWSDTDKGWDPMYSGKSRWVKNTTRNQYYYGAFDSGMPDLNYNNTEVRAEMKNVVKYWLDKGFDGLRIDAVRYLMETESAQTDVSATHTWFKELRSDVLDKYESPKFMVCEAWVEGNRSTLNEYFGNGSEFNMVFDFDAGRPCITSVKNGTDSLGSTLRANYNDSCTYGVFLGNHDEYAGRFGTTLGQDWKKINLSTALSLLRPTVPFIYYGNELGMPELQMSGDIRLRGNFDWSLETAEEADETSPLSVNKVLLSLRKSHPKTFADGSVTKLTAGKTGTIGYVISGNDGDFLCVYNLSTSSVASATFTGNEVSGITEGSCIIGDTDAPSLEFASNSVTVKNIAPCTFRVYKLGTSGVENIYDTESYSEGETYAGLTHSDSMYVRGSMNSWGGTEMTGEISAGSYIWSTTAYLEEGTAQFKFAVDGSDWTKTNWGLDSGNKVKTGTDSNISFTVSTAGLYTITFNETSLTYSITEYQPLYSAMYLRGSMNSWGGTKMTGRGTEDGYIWSVTVSLSAGTCTFKFATSASNWNTNWGIGSTSGEGIPLKSDGDNISFKAASAGSYTISFNENTLTYSVEEGE